MTAVQRSAAEARAIAANVVASVLTEARYLDTVLEEIRASGRNPTDAFTSSLIQELCYGTLRWYHELAGIARLFVTRPFKSKDRDINALLLIGLYQLRHMRVADHAAVDVTVAAADVLKKSWAKGVLNASLRAYLREPQRVAHAIESSKELQYSHPQWLIDMVRRDHPEHWEKILTTNNQRPPMTLRVNTARIAPADYQLLLQKREMSARTHPTVSTALVLDKPVNVEQLPGFDDGLISVQDAGAQLAAVFLNPQPNERILDACAAPGGKTAHILERTKNLARVTALEIDPQRLERLRHNLTRLSLTAHSIAGDAATPSQWWDGVPYDRILLDVPCSATGVIRRHPDIKVRRQANDLLKLTQTQMHILEGVWPCLAQGGKLLYVTCSILSEENAHQIQKFINRHPDAVPEPLGAGTESGERQFLTGEDDMDGFYYGCLHKI